VDTCVIGFWFRIAAKTVEPERGIPDKKCSCFCMESYDVLIAIAPLLPEAIFSQVVSVPT
jgi:hypothetical protein